MSDESEDEQHEGPDYYVSCLCPGCGSGTMWLKESRLGKKFLGCNGYPACTTTLNYDKVIATLAIHITQLQELLTEIEQQYNEAVDKGERKRVYDPT